MKRRETDDVEKQAIDIKLFQSGSWESQYFQYKQWYKSYQMDLTFDTLKSEIIGSGVDVVGTFTIEGIYSTQTRRMALTKKYQLGTGNPLENLGHDVTIQLEWNRSTNQFEGKWYVRTRKFKGDGEFKMNFDRRNEQPSLFTVYEKV